MTGQIVRSTSALLLLLGCTGPKAVLVQPVTAPAPATSVSPTPTPVSQPAPRPAATPPVEPLRPQVPAAEEQKLVESTRQNIGDVARTLGELEGRPMKPPQQEALRTARNFLDQARSALDQRDYQRAANLASKARALTDDVAGATK
jgi:hypothetical protein